MLWKEENVLQGREGLGVQGQTEGPGWELCGQGRPLGITRPTKPFISLWAVCRHVEEVTSETPDDIFIKLLNKVVTASKIADSLHI